MNYEKHITAQFKPDFYEKHKDTGWVSHLETYLKNGEDKFTCINDKTGVYEHDVTGLYVRIEDMAITTGENPSTTPQDAEEDTALLDELKEFEESLK